MTSSTLARLDLLRTPVMVAASIVTSCRRWALDVFNTCEVGLAPGSSDAGDREHSDVLPAMGTRRLQPLRGRQLQCSCRAPPSRNTCTSLVPRISWGAGYPFLTNGREEEVVDTVPSVVPRVARLQQLPSTHGETLECRRKVELRTRKNNNRSRIPPRQNTIIVSDCWPPITEPFDESSAGRIGVTHLIHGASTVDSYSINQRQKRDGLLCRSRRGLELDGLK